MRKRSALILAVCLLLTGCGAKNGTQAEDPVLSTETKQDAILEEEHKIPVNKENIPVDNENIPADKEGVLADDADGGETAEEPDAPWRAAYVRFLEEKAAEAAWIRDPDNPEYDPNWAEAEAAEAVGSYFLYDMDSNGVPELLMCYGDGIHTTVYGCEEGVVTELGDVDSGHASFYTWPGENAVAIRWSHMGGLCLRKLSLSDGALTEEWVYEEFAEESFTPMEDLIPGTLWLRAAHPTVTMPEYGALTLPVRRYGTKAEPQPLDPARDGEAKSAIGQALTGGAEFFGVTADGWGGYSLAEDRFGGDTGLTTMEAYLRPGGVSLYAELPLVVTDRAWLDCNGDGQSEALVSIEYAEGDRSYGSGFAALFSLEEDGRVYAYCVSHVTDCRWNGEGFVSEYDETPFAVAFDLEQAYLYTPGQEMP